jgi:hypothetical protein
VLHTLRLFGEQVIPHFQTREPGAAVSSHSRWSAAVAEG